MPNVQWKWEIGPQVVVSTANFLVLLLGVIGLWFKMQADVAAAKDAVTELRLAFTSMREAQASSTERLVKVETKVDIILPSLQRIELNQRVPGPIRPQ